MGWCRSAEAGSLKRFCTFLHYNTVRLHPHLDKKLNEKNTSSLLLLLLQKKKNILKLFLKWSPGRAELKMPAFNVEGENGAFEK